MRRANPTNPADGASLTDDGDSSITILPVGDAAAVIAGRELTIARARPADGAGEEEAVGNRQRQAPYSIRLPLAQSDDFRMLRHIGDGQIRRTLDVPVVEEKMGPMTGPAKPLDASRKVKLKGRHLPQR
jgi:hypothetical protein